MSHVARKFVLVGPRAGQTVKLGKQFNFTDGALIFEGSEEDADNLGTLLARSYNAHPEGSPAHQRAQEDWDAHTGAPKDRSKAGQGEAQANPTDEAPAGGPQDAGAAPAEEGAPGAQGDGADAIVGALRSLDPDNDDHWTADGRPRMAAIETIMGRTDVTRKDLENALPGFSRVQAGST